MKRIFVIDWLLLVAFVPCLCSGVGLHVAGHGADHEVWHGWAVAHVLASAVCLTAAIFHVRTHWGWYKGIARSGMGRRSRVTALLSVVFAFAAVTGIVLLGVDGTGSSVGMGHYLAGIAAGALSVGHVLKRIPALRGSLKRR